MANKKRDNKKEKRQSRASASTALNFFAEAGLLKYIKRSGWWVAGIAEPESVADHSFRCAVIAYYLARLEGADAYRTVIMALFNDIHEARINDLHKMGHYYIDFKNAEKKVFAEQIRALDARVKGELANLRCEYDAQDSAESIIARDADILECLLQAKEYSDSGYAGARYFFRRAPRFLRSRSARLLWKHMKKWDSNRWWRSVVSFER